MSIEITPTSAPLGAYVRGLDVDSLTPQIEDQLRRAFTDYGLLIFKDVGLSVAQQLRLSHVFGPTVPHPVVPAVLWAAMPRRLTAATSPLKPVA